MIIGFVGVSPQIANKVFDYMASLYPEGIISTDKSILFDHDQIDKIIFEGYSDEEDKYFKVKLKEAIDEENINNKDIEIPKISKENLKDIETLDIQ